MDINRLGISEDGGY